MTYLTWRQHRLPALAAVALLAAFAALILVTGLQAAAQWHSALAVCTAAHDCGSALGDIFLGSHPVGFLVILTVIVPAILGMLAGAPLVAQELETGTVRFAWTQGVTRARWLAIRAAWVLLGTAVLAGAISALVTWWSGPNNALQANGFQPGRFDIMGIAPVGYTVFAVALGIAAGAVTRRVVPAMGITLVGFIAIRAVIFIWARQRYLGAVTHVYGLTQGYAPPGAAWQIASGVSTPAGQLVPMTDGAVIAPNVSASVVPGSCHGLDQAVLSCMQSAGFRQFVTFQPADRYWLFQGIETGVFVALAAALIAVAFMVLRRRDA